jgi:hypothetical protein
VALFGGFGDKTMKEIALLIFGIVAMIPLSLAALSLALMAWGDYKEAKHRRMIETLKAQGRHREIV